MTYRSLYDHDTNTVASCLSIVERGLRRLGVNPNASMTRMALRTLSAPRADDEREKAQARAIRKRGGYELSEHQVARMVELSTAGKTQAQIALEIGCRQSTVAKRLAKARHKKDAQSSAVAA